MIATEIYSKNADCSLQQVQHCYDRAQLKAWCSIVQQDLRQIKLQIDDAVDTGDYDPDWLYRTRQARKYQQQLITAIQARLEALKQQQKLLQNQDFEAYLIERLRQVIGEEAFTTLLEQARRDYRAEKILGL